MSEVATPSSKPISHLGKMLITLVMGGWLLTVAIQSRRTVSHEQSLASHNRLDVPASQWADENSCIDCHEQAMTFFETGHARTLSPADDSSTKDILKLLANTANVRDEGTSVDLSGAFPVASSQRDDFSSQTILKWCVGSGNHARTWISLIPDSRGNSELLEFRWTWYRQSLGFDVTPGQPDLAGEGHFNRLGVYFDHPKARRCFECHASSIPIEQGRILESQIRCGVTCQRCHGAMADHVQSGGELRPQSLKTLTPRESVLRCAECHRDPNEFEPQMINPQNAGISRFQPIGLMQSKCFQNSELSCLTCHNPHRTLESQNSRGDWQCLQCHDGKTESSPRCGDRQTSDCIRCHMPAVPQRRPVAFTDHWIRIHPRERKP